MLDPQIHPGKVVYARFEFLGIEEDDRGAPKWAQWGGPRAVCVAVDSKGEWFDNCRIYLRPEILVPAPIVKAEIQRAKERGA